MRNWRQHITDLVFILALFGAFAVTALLVVVLGADVYQGISESMGVNDSARSCVTYISQKVRQQDAAGDVALGRVGQADALILTQHVDGQAYVTWIYPYQGGLYELTLYAQGRPTPGDGQRILSLADLQLTAQGDCIAVEAMDASGNRFASAITLRCGAVEVRP